MGIVWTRCPKCGNPYSVLMSRCPYCNPDWYFERVKVLGQQKWSKDEKKPGERRKFT